MNNFLRTDTFNNLRLVVCTLVLLAHKRSICSSERPGQRQFAFNSLQGTSLLPFVSFASLTTVARTQAPPRQKPVICELSSVKWGRKENNTR